MTDLAKLIAHTVWANGEWITISTARASIQARALVTARMPSLDVDGRRIHQVGLHHSAVRQVSGV